MGNSGGRGKRTRFRRPAWQLPRQNAAGLSDAASKPPFAMRRSNGGGA
jgi:hypothetical protein